MKPNLVRRLVPGGFGVVEFCAASALTLVATVLAFRWIDHGNRGFEERSNLAAAHETGDAMLRQVGGDLTLSGYDPRSTHLRGLKAATARHLRLRSDRDGTGTIGSTPDEDVTYVFTDPDGNGVFDLVRGIDLDGDLAFAGRGESSSVLAGNLVPIDLDGDGRDDPFFDFDREPPWATRVTVTFGVRPAGSGRSGVVGFQTEVALRTPTP